MSGLISVVLMVSAFASFVWGVYVGVANYIIVSTVTTIRVIDGFVGDSGAWVAAAVVAALLLLFLAFWFWIQERL